MISIIKRLTLRPAVSLIGAILFFLSPDAKAGEVEFGFSTSLSERYEDNIDLEEEDLEDEDYITSFTPNLSLSYVTPSTDFHLIYNPAIEFYAKNSDENEVRQNGNLDLNSQLTPRLRLTATDVLSFTPGQDIAGEEEFEERGRRSRSYASDRLSNVFNTTLSYQILQCTSLRGGVSHSFDNYDRSEQSDSYEYGFDFGFDHQLTGKDTLFGKYRYRVMRYDKSEENDTDVQSVTVGETHQFPRALLLTISGGVSWVDEDNEDRETDWNCHVSLRKDFRTGSLNLSFDREFSASSGDGDTTVINTYNVTGIKELSRHLTGTLSAFFAAEESASGDEVDTEDWGMNLGSTYQFSRKLSGTLSCSFVRQNSMVQGEGDTDNYRGRVNIDYLLLPNWSVFSSYSYYQQNARDPIEDDIENNVFEFGLRVTWF
ncbi:MAG: outer membrane beta-barrel protein [Thermodesulfobacteriota bacterium]|nr:outer membrane beta-barrel protein [Thermodesulfobacteriota bacterium]